MTVRPMAAAALLTAALLTAALALAACGGPPGTTVNDPAAGALPSPAGGTAAGEMQPDEPADAYADIHGELPSTVLLRFVDAVAAGDTTTACGFLDIGWHAAIEQQAGTSCPVYVARATDRDELAGGFSIDTTEWEFSPTMVEFDADSVLAPGSNGNGFDRVRDLALLDDSAFVRTDGVWKLAFTG